MVCDNTRVKFSPKPLAQPSNIGVANHKLLNVFNSYLEVHLKSLRQTWLNLMSMSKTLIFRAISWFSTRERNPQSCSLLWRLRKFQIMPHPTIFQHTRFFLHRVIKWHRDIFIIIMVFCSCKNFNMGKETQQEVDPNCVHVLVWLRYWFAKLLIPSPLQVSIMLLKHLR